MRKRRSQLQRTCPKSPKLAVTVGNELAALCEDTFWHTKWLKKTRHVHLQVCQLGIQILDAVGDRLCLLLLSLTVIRLSESTVAAAAAAST